MPKKRKSSARTRSSVRVKSRSVSSRTSPAARIAGRFIIPLLIVIALGTAIVFLGLSGYSTATASDFFVLKDVSVYGTDRTSVEDVKRIVTASAEKPGVWNADLGEIREKLEKLTFVKSAAVSRVLPSGIRINVTERTPAAVVQLSSGKYLVDGEATVLKAVTTEEKEFPFVLKGWDEAKTEAAATDNLNRIKLYKKMLEEWRQFDLSRRVKEVNLTNPRAPVAVVEDSGRPVGITLAKDDLGRSLKGAIEALTGKGNRVKSIDAGGLYPVIQYLEF